MNNPPRDKILERIAIAPAPGWARVREPDLSFTPAEKGHVTILLSDDQYHAETRQHYKRIVQRLETLHAVQDVSQYKIDFDPNTQMVAIHSIAIIRDGTRREQAQLGRFHTLQREERLQAFVIRGLTTLLILLEDVRAGDIIDASCTITTFPRLLPERFCLFHHLPFAVPVRALHVDVRFNRLRPMQWRSSSKDLAPEIQETGDEICCTWKKENLLEAIPEPNLPAWFIAGTWIQMSDCPTWLEVVQACLKTWPLHSATPGIKEVAEQIMAETATDEERAEKAITYVQDGFRYLSVNIEFGGYIPSPPDDVIRRRFGDCKDLACLLASLLRAMGISAHPVLVDTLTLKVRDFLPMPQAFNHVVVEYDIGAGRRWVDPVRSLQGGGIQRHAIGAFRQGLILDGSIRDLQPMPDQPKHEGLYKLKESFFISTAGTPTLLEVTLTATGAEADKLRRLFASEPEAVIAADRETFYTRFFPQVKRVTAMEHKDNRAANEFHLSEIFEIVGAVRPSGHETCFFVYASHLVQNVFRQPLHEERKHPCAIPHPYNVEHIIEIDFAGLQTGALPPYHRAHQLFRLGRKSKFAYNYHTASYTLETLGDCIQPEQFAEFRKLLDEIWLETTLLLELPLGVHSRKRKPRDLKR